MNVAYDLEFDLDGFLSSLEKGRTNRPAADESQSARRRVDDGVGCDDGDE